MPEASLEKSKRSFSKRMIALNTIGAWVFLIFSTVSGQVEYVIAPVLTFVTFLVGIYTGVGHLDYSRVLAFMMNNRKESDA